MRKLLILVLLSSCVQDKYISDPSLLPYVKEFEYQASIRGIKINWNNLRIISKDSLKNNWDAYYTPNTHRIYINETTYNWSINTEEIMMHELGHAVLGRDHDYGFLGENVWLKKSVMGYLNNPLFSTVDSLNYRKEYYYDELFNSNTQEPSWVY